MLRDATTNAFFLIGLSCRVAHVWCRQGASQLKMVFFFSVEILKLVIDASLHLLFVWSKRYLGGTIESAEIQEVVERVGGGTTIISTPAGNLSHINLTPHFHTCGTMGSECRVQ